MRKDFLSSFFDSLFNEDSFHFSISGKLSDVSFPQDDNKNFNKTEEISETETHMIKKEVWTSINGGQRFERTTKQTKSKAKLKQSKDELTVKLNEAIQAQDFENACKLRDEIKQLK
jgi:excinuclease UvrABC helicase subunit UvrB